MTNPTVKDDEAKSSVVSATMIHHYRDITDVAELTEISFHFVLCAVLAHSSNENFVFTLESGAFWNYFHTIQKMRGNRGDSAQRVLIGEGDEAEAFVRLHEWILHDIYVGDVAELPEIPLKFSLSGLPR